MIDAELRKKVEQANKAKDARIKKALKSPDKDVSIEKDAFDLEELNNKSLNEKLGSPLKGAKKKAAPKKGDAMKQTKLSFGAVAKKDTSTADESEPDEFDLMLEDAVPLRYLSSNFFFSLKIVKKNERKKKFIFFSIKIFFIFFF